MREIIYLILALSALVGLAYLLLKYPNIAEHYHNPSPELHTPNLAGLVPGLSNSMPRVETGDKKTPEPTNFMEAMNHMMQPGKINGNKNDPKAALESISKMFENASNIKFGDFSSPQNTPPPTSQIGSMSPMNALKAALSLQNDNKPLDSSKNDSSKNDSSKCLANCAREFQKCSSSC
jgi:hypothetical protein